MLNNELLNKYPDVVPEQEPLIILDIKSYIWMAKNGKDTKHTRNFSRRMNFVRNGEEFNLHKAVWCKGVLQLVDIGTKNFREYELNHILGCAMVIIDNWHNTCQRGVRGYIIFWGTIFSELINKIEFMNQLNEFENFV